MQRGLYVCAQKNGLKYSYCIMLIYVNYIQSIANERKKAWGRKISQHQNIIILCINSRQKKKKKRVKMARVNALKIVYNNISTVMNITQK